MQTHSVSALHHLIFPPAPGKAGPAAASQDGESRQLVHAGLVESRAPGKPPSTPPVAGPLREEAPTPAKQLLASATAGVVYTSALETVRAAAQAEGIAVDTLSLDALVSLGKSRGLFTKITYSRETPMDGDAGKRGAAGASAELRHGSNFVSAAVDVMRDFEEGMRALTGSAGKDNARPWNSFSR